MKAKSLIPTRTNICPVRFSDVEIELVEEGAKLAGVNRGEFIREAAKARAARLLKDFERKSAAESAV